MGTIDEESREMSWQLSGKPPLIGLPILAAFGGFVSGILVFVLVEDWIFTTIVATGVGAIGAICVDILIRWVSLKRRLTCYGRMGQIGLVVGVSIANLMAAVFLSATNRELFESVFVISPPRGVSEVEVSRHYAGGPGDMVILARFLADQDAINEILAARDFCRVDKFTQLYNEGDVSWDEFWRSQISGAERYESTWKEVPPMTQPHVYEWHNNADPYESVRLLWDVESRRAYAMYQYG